MAPFLHRIGRGAFRRRWPVLLLWVLLLGAVGAATAGSGGSAGENITLPGTEAQKAFDLLGEKFPTANAEGASVRVVFKAPDGEKLTGTRQTEVTRLLKDVRGSSSQIAQVTDPFRTGAISADRSTGYAQVTYRAKAGDLTDGDHERLDRALDRGRDRGLTVEASGSALAPVGAGMSSEAVGFALAALILVITFGSLAAAGMPLLTALIGVGITTSAITALTAALDLNSSTSALASMLGIAVGIDYALFIVSRYRSERADGHDAREAAARANGTAGSAVVFAGLTVVVALAGLAVVDLPVLTAMGLAAAGAVTIAVLVAVTLVPALLAFAPERVRGRAARKRQAVPAQETAPAGKPLGERWAAFVLRRPLKVLLVAVLGLVVVALPATRLELGLPDDGSQPASTTQRKAYDMLAGSFGPGFNGPLTLVVSDDDPARAKAAATGLGDRIKEMKGVATVTPAAFNQDGDTAIVTVIPDSAPAGDATKELVHDIREITHDPARTGGAEALVTGTTALNIDVSAKFTSAILPYLALVVGLAFLILILVFRSLLVPLKAALGFLLSVLASLGALVAVFQWGWLKGLFGLEVTGPVMSLMPILTVGIVFGLAMDYQVFLVTRIREAHVHGADPRRAITEGFAHSGRVVTVAALIMTFVFAGFIGADEAMIKALGFGLAAAVLLDAFVVRMTIVPAVLALLGERAWQLPRWIDRILPRVDIEGENLARPAGPARPGSEAGVRAPAHSGHH
ncbi:MMPL family transporter [Streptomyces sp. NPDC056347]|uniref:MMPL family transporter n=1 Tax=Streptomyces sp. NPDC056347 TaxID=3345790 RepID=UPI0035DADA68